METLAAVAEAEAADVNTVAVVAVAAGKRKDARWRCRARWPPWEAMAAVEVVR